MEKPTSPSRNSVAEVENTSETRLEWTSKEERALRQKLDLRILPVVFILFMLCFIDRTNIGNACIEGMGTNLNLYGYRFNIALTIFYIPYILVEILSNVLLKIIGGRFYILTLVFLFGLVSMCTAFVHSYRGLLTCRFFLGVTEGGVLPGIAYYLSTFYRRKELMFRISLFIIGASMAGAFGGLLAAALSKIPRWGVALAPIKIWRNIFFLEGLLSMLVSFVGMAILPNSPESCRFLPECLRAIGVERMNRDYQESANERTQLRHVKQAITSLNAQLCAFIFLFLNVAIQSFSLFLPTILRALGYSSTQAQLRSVAPYVAACACAIATAWASDKTGRRGVFICGASHLGRHGGCGDLDLRSYYLLWLGK